MLRSLHLHRVGAGLLEEPSGVADPVVERDLVGDERHVADDHRAIGAARDGGGVVEHLLHRHRERRPRSPRTLFADGVAHEQDRDAGLVEDPGGGGVVGGEHHPPLAPVFHARRSWIVVVIGSHLLGVHGYRPPSVLRRLRVRPPG